MSAPSRAFGVLFDIGCSVVLAFTTFSRVPMPRVAWREGSMRYMMAAFPLVGLVIGACLWAWCALCGALAFGPLLASAGIALVPLAVTGGIHMDGFADVVDASASHAAPERKREILKDPHIGAFAPIAIAAYLIGYVALLTEVPFTARTCVLLACMHVLVRCLSGLAVTLFPKSAGEGMLAMFRVSADKRPVVAVLVCLCLASAACMAGASSAAAVGMVAAALACFFGLRVFADRQFGGMSGDLAGFFLQVAELAMVAVLTIVSKAVWL